MSVSPNNIGMIERPKTPWKTEKTTSLVKELVAEFLGREAGAQSLITVTDLQMSSDRKRALVFLSIFPDAMAQRAIEFANRKRSEIKEHIRSKSRMRMAPHLEFVLDTGEKNRQRIDEILHEDQRERKIEE